MPFRPSRSAPIAELGQFGVSSRKRVVLILSVPALSLLLPALAVEVASSGTSEPSRIAGAVAKFLLFYSGVFALIGLSAAVAAGLLAADRIVLSPHARILAQTAHRTTSLIGMSALANHIMLEIMANRAGIADSMIPFLAVRSTFFMGLGTISSDVFVLVIVTGVLRRRFTMGSRPELWRWLHITAYGAWVLGILHGLLAGRSAKPYVDWSYGACLVLAALALVARYVQAHRHRTALPDDRPGPGTVALSSLPSLMPPPAGPAVALPQLPAGPGRAVSQPHDAPARALSQPHARPPAPPPMAPPVPPQPRPQPTMAPQRALRALPSPDTSSSRPWPRPPRWSGAPWSDPGDAGDGPYADDNGYASEAQSWMESPDTWAGEAPHADDNGYAGEPESWTESPDAWRPRPDRFDL